MGLPFVRGRIHPYQDDIPEVIASQRSHDRTAILVRKYLTLVDNLPMIKSQTLTCCEVAESKGGAVVLRIFDRPKFEAIKQSIHDQEEQITAIEAAMRELDSMHCGWIDEMLATRSSLAHVEPQQRQLLSTFATAALQRGTGLNRRQGPEACLASDQIYQKKKAQVEKQIETAKKGLDDLIPRIEKIESILSSCGC
jgi:hypothetical protein